MSHRGGYKCIHLSVHVRIGIGLDDRVGWGTEHQYSANKLSHYNSTKSTIGALLFP